MLASELIARFEEFAPLKLKWHHDPTGLQIGDPQQEIHKVLVTLDVRPEVVDEAIAVGADMIFAHHPVMFRPADNLDYQEPQKAMYGKIAAHHILVYAAHTNLDCAEGGMNDWLAQALQLQHVTGLVPGYREPAVKLTVTVPAAQAEMVQECLVSQHQAQVDRYALNSGEQFSVDLLKADLSAAVTAITGLVGVDNWDYQVTPLLTGGKQYAMGRIGDLVKPMTVQNFALACKAAFHVDGLRLISNQPDQFIQRVAVLGGDGGKFYQTAQQQGAQVYVTGDVYYHTGHDMLAAGISVIDPGHHIESICKPQLTRLFKKWQAENQWSLSVVASQLNTDPFTFI
ncbi:Nif3-like dinuclear metal center hexameric protein [Lactiplantibacillus mudanjiangensis]|uniref:GTP cyclohydrolase 1 type 2 homolog n=1 Tax=Lactiplantibacillus mudanjiangensis TaxID=1296538 RepID=A0A660E2X7_9LACO|nr:Nif3-like dinuclear metal center hexameric protein [Lactiplantibacillus mudanjiangensis]VDG20523.1 Nif3-like dinuclear metal center hexameric protein [Lactobacillus pentosus] [Lactiplantibacillus mudanjiangensis]VDG25430.1 Nif3-like dinuclear metal center hexameric protein [Lactobacillus pentosus] [Lactiplantibacillus mudanjiangensis]VDG30486.1 Nif3-like dinuclear metal center hexameric protein [Lactobacillus pentosus] [Lactiplantibacillus mudanjiangensis]